MHYARVPRARLGVLIGPKGKTKRIIEEVSGVTLHVDSETGEVTIDDSKAEDPLLALKARDVAVAIGRGFSEEKALRLLDEVTYFKVLDIRDFVGKSINRVREMRGRLIGTHGKTRRIIEELSGAAVSVYGTTAAIIGDVVEMETASRAVEMILEGSEHATVYRYLERMRRQMKMAELDWEEE
jgi:ribosomal RNA assembly protein